METDSPQRKALIDEYLAWQDFGGAIVLSPDWTVDIPLWPHSEAAHQLVPESLLEKIIAWQTIFDSNYRWGDDTRPEGWVSEETKDQWKQEAPIIVAELSSALEGKAELIVDLWPMVRREQNRELQEYSARRKAESERWDTVLKEAGINLVWRAYSTDDEENEES
jgi:hypothetical protein